MPAQIGLAFVQGERTDDSGNQYDVFYMANVHEDGYIYFDDEYNWRCKMDKTSLQILNLPSHIWCLSEMINITDITFFDVDTLINMANGGNAVTGTGVEYACNLACSIADDDSHGYSQYNRNGNPDFDCSSLVYHVFRQAGFSLPSYNGWTGSMVSDFTAAGFTWLSGYGNSIDNLQRGDILLNEQYHTEIYLGNYQNVGAHCDEFGGISGDNPGDQTGNEISVSGWYSYPWDGVLRWQHGNSVNP